MWFIVFPCKLEVDLLCLLNLTWDEISTMRKYCFSAKNIMIWYDIKVVDSWDKPIKWTCEKCQCVSQGGRLVLLCSTYLLPGTWVTFFWQKLIFLYSLASLSLACSHSGYFVLWRRFMVAGIPVVWEQSELVFHFCFIMMFRRWKL